MLGTIPIGNGNNHISSTVLWVYVLGSVIGSAVLGLLIGCIRLTISHEWSGAKPSWVLLMTGFVAVCYGASDFHLMDMPRLGFSWQVPHRWRLTMRPVGYAFSYGFVLGMGITTRIASGAFYVACIWCSIMPKPIFSSLAVMCFGLARAAPLVAFSRLAKQNRWNIRNAKDRLTDVVAVPISLQALFLACIGSILLTSAVTIAAYRR